MQALGTQECSLSGNHNQAEAVKLRFLPQNLLAIYYTYLSMLLSNKKKMRFLILSCFSNFYKTVCIVVSILESLTSIQYVEISVFDTMLEKLTKHRGHNILDFIKR